MMWQATHDCYLPLALLILASFCLLFWWLIIIKSCVFQHFFFREFKEVFQNLNLIKEYFHTFEHFLVWLSSQIFWELTMCVLRTTLRYTFKFYQVYFDCWLFVHNWTAWSILNLLRHPSILGVHYHLKHCFQLVLQHVLFSWQAERIIRSWWERW